MHPLLLEHICTKLKCALHIPERVAQLVKGFALGASRHPPSNHFCEIKKRITLQGDGRELPGWEMGNGTITTPPEYLCCLHAVGPLHQLEFTQENAPGT